MSMLRLPRVTCVLLCFLSLGCATDPGTIARRQHSARVKEALGITLPCKLGSCWSNLDGGSVGGTLIGANGDTLKWAWDGATHGLPPLPAAIRGDAIRVNAWSDSVVWAMPRHVYLGATNYRSPEARALEFDSPIESLFISTLEACVGADSAHSAQEVMTPARQARSALYFIKKHRARRAESLAAKRATGS